MSASEPRAAVEDLLYREALALDERRWDDWLALYHERAEFWVPAWKSDDEATTDPEGEISLMYLASRSELAERVARVRSGRSAASVPLPRTAHALSNLLVESGGDDGLVVRSIATTHVFDVKRREQYLFFARVQHRLVRADGAWRIRRKTIVLLNDYIPTAIDFYTV